jgi:hypothetical protein
MPTPNDPRIPVRADLIVDLFVRATEEAHAAGFTAGVLAGLKWAREEREFCDGLPGRPAFLPTLDDAIAHVERTGGLPEQEE